MHGDPLSVNVRRYAHPIVESLLSACPSARSTVQLTRLFRLLASPVRGYRWSAVELRRVAIHRWPRDHPTGKI